LEKVQQYLIKGYAKQCMIRLQYVKQGKVEQVHVKSKCGYSNLLYPRCICWVFVFFFYFNL